MIRKVRFFICPVFKKFCIFHINSLNKSVNAFKAVNNTPISILGSISTVINLQSLSNYLAEINLHVLGSDSISADLIIGCDFFKYNKIKIIYNPFENSENKLNLLHEVAFSNMNNETCNDLDSILLDFNIDFDNVIKNQLISFLKEVENSEVEIDTEDYLVKVVLKDDTTYAYAPRRFAWSERLQIREITDDLLKRGIIKYSNSPYCARVVPVRKKNDSLRLCVDLRPLNDRIIKQKYPFVLIEDCLARLSNKTIFSLLDLKDGFHQIKLHPDHMKYFSFATPDG